MHGVSYSFVKLWTLLYCLDYVYTLTKSCRPLNVLASITFRSTAKTKHMGIHEVRFTHGQCPLQMCLHNRSEDSLGLDISWIFNFELSMHFDMTN